MALPVAGHLLGHRGRLDAARAGRCAAEARQVALPLLFLLQFCDVLRAELELDGGWGKVYDHHAMNINSSSNNSNNNSNDDDDDDDNDDDLSSILTSNTSINGWMHDGLMYR